MHKEIHEQPTAIGETLKSFIDLDTKSLKFNSKLFNKILNRITMIACGTSSYACRVARLWFEKLQGFLYILILLLNIDIEILFIQIMN